MHWHGLCGRELELHEDCVRKYQESLCPKCAQCGEVLLGPYCMLGDNPLHVDCVDAFRKA